MATFNQLIKGARKRQAKKTKAPALRGSGQLQGTVIKVYVVSPKKPNSANRRVALVRLSNGLKVICYDPGEKTQLQEHQTVLVRGGRVKDLPGVRYHLIRGARDSKGAVGPSDTNQQPRRQSRSKYGVKRNEEKAK